MKKLYTLIAVAAAALTATAASPSLVNNLTVASELNGKYVPALNHIDREYNPDAVVEAPEGTWNVIGEGSVAEGFLEDINSEISADPGMTWAVTIEQLAEDHNWYRTVVYNENSPMMDITGEPDADYFYFNVADPDKVFSTPFYIGAGTYVVFQNCEESGLYEMLKNPDGLAADPSYGKYENGLITFPAYSFWVLDEENSRFLGVDTQGAFSIALPGTTIPSMWIDLGTSTWSDGIMAPMFGSYEENEDGSVTAVPVESTIMVQVSSKDDYVFRLVQPWNAWFEGYFDDTKNLIVDMTYVYEGNRVGAVDQQSTGVVDSDMGLCYVISKSINYSNGLAGFVADTARYPKYNISFDEETRLLYFPPNCMYFYFPSYNAQGLYNWGDEGAAASSVVIPENSGLQNVVAESSNGAPEFYNLQGIRVTNPANGIYIVRTGNKVTKTYIR